MLLLIVEKDIGAKAFEESTFIQPAQKQRLVNADVPTAQGADYPLVCGCRARSDERRTYWRSTGRVFGLDAVQGGQERRKRPAR